MSQNMQNLLDENGDTAFKLDELITRSLSRLGRYQLAVLIAINISFPIVGISDIVTSFHSYTPSFYCADYNSTNSCDFGDQTCPSGFIFNTTDDFTVVSEWSLICSRRLLAPLISTMYFMGAMLGAPIFGFVADKWGRRFGLLIAIHVQAVIGLILYFVQSFEFFIVLRTLQGLFIQGLQVCIYTLLQEYSPTRLRTIFGGAADICWTMGLLILGVTSYFVPNWRLMQLYLTIPTVIVILYVWFLPESILWMYSIGRKKAMLKQCLKTTKLNGHKELYKEFQQFCPDNLKLSTEKEEIGFISVFLDVIRTRCLRKHFLVMIYLWFLLTLSYYGILFFLPNLSGDRHSNFLSGVSIEVFGYLLTIIIFTKFGRRIPLVVMPLIEGAILLILGFLYWKGIDESWIIPALALTAKGLSASCYSGMAFYTCELFPTIFRVAAYGFCTVTSHAGSLLAPYFMILAEYTSPTVPLSIMGGMLVVGGLLILFLPETLNKPLPNTIDDAKDMWERDDKVHVIMGSIEKNNRMLQ